jgi:hypothetical protein
MSTNSKTSNGERESELLRHGLAFLHQAREMRDLGPAQVERIRRRLKGRIARPRRRVLLPAAAGLALVLVAGAALAVAKGGLRALPVLGPLFVPATSTEPPKATKHPQPALRKPALGNPPAAAPVMVFPVFAPSPAPALDPVPASEPEPAKASTPHSVRQADPRPRTLAMRDTRERSEAARAMPAPEMPAPPAAADKVENPVVAESRSFASVIEPWHRTRNASATLALLDAHEWRYPSGQLLLESRLLRAEIYLAQGREREALAVLDSVSLSGIPRARELQTVRGELRIRAGRCTEGKRDFDDVLEKGMADALGRRAMQAISHCP